MAAGGHARPVVVLDNGAYEIKYGWATDAAAPDRPRYVSAPAHLRSLRTC